MTDFSYPGASSFNNVPLGSYVDSRPTTGLSYSPKKKSGSAPNSPMALNGRYTPRSAITPLRRLDIFNSFWRFSEIHKIPTQLT